MIPLWQAARSEDGDVSRLLAALAHAVPLPSRWENGASATCSRCGAEAMAHDLWVCP